MTIAIQTSDVTSASRQNASAASSASGRDERKWQIAQDFEAMFFHQMLKSMRNTVPDEGLAGEQSSSGRRIFTSMFDEEMSRLASRQGGLGLAQQIYRQIAGDSSGASLEKAVSANRTYSASERRRASAAEIDDWVSEASESLGVDPDLVRSVIQQESGGDSLALSPKGAKGLMQLMDGTARDMGVQQVWNGRQNVIGGTRYLKKLLNQFNGDETLALAAYNAGPETVRMHGGVPPYQETQQYVQKVLDHRRTLQQDKEV